MVVISGVRQRQWFWSSSAAGDDGFKIEIWRVLSVDMTPDGYKSLRTGGRGRDTFGVC